MSDDDILVGFRAGDPAVFRLLYDRYYRQLFVYSCKITGHTAESEDIVLNVLSNLFLGYQDKVFEDLSHLQNYLFKAIRNRSRNYFRNPSADELTEAHDAGYDPINDRLDMAYREKLFDLRLRRRIDGLEHRSVEVLVMLYFEDMSLDEVAERMGISKETVKTHRKRGLQLLSKILNEDDFLLQTLVFLIITLPKK
jgi:RNA polymerase sigma-70 factor (ECF subfamily)